MSNQCGHSSKISDKKSAVSVLANKIAEKKSALSVSANKISDKKSAVSVSANKISHLHYWNVSARLAITITTHTIEIAVIKSFFKFCINIWRWSSFVTDLLWILLKICWFGA